MDFHFANYRNPILFCFISCLNYSKPCDETDAIFLWWQIFPKHVTPRITQETGHWFKSRTLFHLYSFPISIIFRSHVSICCVFTLLETTICSFLKATKYQFDLIKKHKRGTMNQEEAKLTEWIWGTSGYSFPNEIPPFNFFVFYCLFSMMIFTIMFNFLFHW